MSLSKKDNYWKNKYLFYKHKNDILKKKLNAQRGGKTDDSKIKYLKILNKIKEGLKTKGYVFWFDIQGNILSQGLDTKSAKTKIVKMITENKDKFKNAILTELVIEFDPSNVMDETSGGLSISVDLNKVIFDNDKLSIQMKNKQNSLLSLCYKYDELSSFKISDLKKISLFVSNETLNKLKSDIYHYHEIKKYIS